MKKLLTLTALALSVVGIANAQSPRLVFIEEFTQASCPPCASQNPQFDALIHNSTNSSKVVALKLHTSWPGVDEMNAHNPAPVQTRVTYYGVTGVPTATINGVQPTGANYTGCPLNITQSMIDKEAAKPANYDFLLTHHLNDAGDSIFITGKIKCTKDDQGDLRATFAVIEKEVIFSKPPGTNGEKDFEEVMKTLLPTDQGANMPAIMHVGDSVVINTKWKLANIYDISEVAVVGYIQEYTTKDIRQAAYSAPNLPFLIAIDEKAKSQSSAFTSETGKAFDMNFTTTSDSTDTYVAKLTNTLPTGWTSKFTIDGIDYAAGTATFTASKATPKTITLTIASAPGALDAKATASMVINSSTQLQGYKVSKNFAAYSPASTMVVHTDPNTAPTKITSALKSSQNAYIVAPSTDFDGFTTEDMTPAKIKHIWYNTGSVITGTISDDVIELLTAYIDNGGKLLLSGGMIGYDAAYGSQNAGLQEFYSTYLGLDPFVLENPSSPATELNRGGNSIYATTNDYVLRPLQEEGESTTLPASTSSVVYYGDLITPTDASVTIPMLNYEQEESQIIGVRTEDKTKGSKIAYLALRYDAIKDASYRNTMEDRIIKWFDGMDLTGVDILKENVSMNIRPNPSDKETKITFGTSLKNECSLKVYNILGQLVYASIINTGTKETILNTSSLNQGLYTLRIEDNGSVISTSKLNVNR